MNSLAIEKDPYMGVAFMAVMYNVGAYSQIANVVGLLNPNVYQTTCANPNARTLMGNGNSNYVPDILAVVQAEVNASRQYEKNNANLTLVDFQITERALMDMFFGDNGTVAAQGNGGLLLHYYDPAAPGNVTAIRQQIWNTLDAAFTILKGKAPTASGTTISYRYDFLALLRTVKDQFPFLKQKQPSSGDAATLIPEYSGHYPACGGTGASDEIYPYSGTSVTVNAAGDVTVYDTVTDETQAKSVKWTLDYNWLVWNDAAPVDTSSLKKRIFSFTALKTDINSYLTQPDGQSGHYIWIMASDASGNSIFKKISVTAKYPSLDSAIIQDVNGDGLGDKITVYLTRSTADSADQLSSFSNFRYSWPSQTTLVSVPTGVTAVGNTLVYSGLPASPGAGLGTVAVDYPSKSGISASLLDRVGPALSSAMSRTGQTASVPDTLVVTVTEPIKNLSAANTAYLNFKKAGTTTQTPIASVSVVKQGTTGASWEFIFPGGTLASYDSVNFVATPGLVSDTVGNPPLAINRMVRIQKQGAKYPSLDSAIIQDVNGDGLGDKITAYLTPSTADGADLIGSFKVFQYSWPGQTPLVTAATASVAVNGTTLVYTGLTPSAGAGLGMIDLDYPSLSGLTTALLDRVGPSLTSAISKATRNATVPDTLVVTITEPIQTLTAANTAYLNFKKAGASAATPVASTSVATTGTSTSWVFIFPGGTVAAYDSVNFVSGSGLVLDAVGNPPLAINRMVAIQKQSFAVSLVKLVLTAVPDSGTISAGDSVVLVARVLDDTGGVRTEYNARISWSPLAPSGTRSSLRTQTGATNTFYGIDAYKTYSVKASFTDTANPATVFFDSVRVYVAPGKAFRIVIEADTNANRNAATPDTVMSMNNATNTGIVYAIVRDAYGNYSGLGTNAQWSSVDTAIASVGAAAGRNYAGTIRRVTSGVTYVVASQTGVVSDSIRVEIAASVLTALRLVNAGSGDTVTSIVMKDDQQMTLTLIGTMSNAPDQWVRVSGVWAMNPATIDLTFPLPSGPAGSWTLGPISAGQTGLTVSSGTLSVTVPVKVTAAIRILRSIACDNPFTPGLSAIPVTKRSGNDPVFGTRIEVTLSAPPVDNAGNVLVSGNITIFDAVGNVIMEKKDMRPDGPMLYTVWDGKNRKGVWVAAGNYLAKVEIVNMTDNTSTALRIIIGVR